MGVDTSPSPFSFWRCLHLLRDSRPSTDHLAPSLNYEEGARRTAATTASSPSRRRTSAFIRRDGSFFCFLLPGLGHHEPPHRLSLSRKMGIGTALETIAPPRESDRTRL